MMREYLVDLDAKVLRTIRVLATDEDHARRDAEKQFRAQLDGYGLEVESLEGYEVNDDE